MKRYTFHVPHPTILVCAIYAETEEAAWAGLRAGECEHLSTMPGHTFSGKAELVNVQDKSNGGKND